ncbi:MAG TPA: methyltransferase domain-containing protein [Baekduia sp.]|uniref:class I SAM-dependent methyltransferase n=1 Tax=Baekduia sp. TaxID=2600305 RepID=UPI002D7709C4|nr:methyltransferase domain-containing protein [Baekduia sp.]HET6509511.1 methyltransferase domain-containing protein [Baekduia sp.]
MTAETVRAGSYGQHRRHTPVDRLGVWLSTRAVRRHGSFHRRRVADLGCGYDATFASTLVDDAASVLLVDLALAERLKEIPKVSAVEGSLPDVLPTLPDASLDVVLCLSVLEHLWEPREALGHIRRVLAPGGTALLNVPSWRGKRFLELSAFRLGLSPAEEMDDHKRYYDPRDLWPLLVAAGFRPRGIRCHRHKLGLNTFAVCRVPEDAGA